VAWVEIGAVAIVLFLLLGLAAGFMARATTSTNLAWLTGIGTLLRGGRGEPAPWVSDTLRGEDPEPDKRDDGRG